MALPQVLVLILALDALGYFAGMTGWYGPVLRQPTTPVWAWPFIPDCPLFGLLGGLALLLGLPMPVAPLLLLLASLVLTIIFVAIYRLRPDSASAVMGSGAALWVVGNLLWLLGSPLASVVPWWVGFLVVTVAGERLELSRILMLRPSIMRSFLLIIALFVAGLALSLFNLAWGVRVAGLGLCGLGAWLLRFDIARRTIRKQGLAQFIAACLLPGYLWLMLAGGAWAVWGERFLAGPPYDAMLHMILLGFVFSMIFGHGPIILPAVLRIEMPFRPAFFAHLLLLHLSLLLRVTGAGEEEQRIALPTGASAHTLVLKSSGRYTVTLEARRGEESVASTAAEISVRARCRPRLVLTLRNTATSASQRNASNHAGTGLPAERRSTTRPPTCIARSNAQRSSGVASSSARRIDE